MDTVYVTYSVCRGLIIEHYMHLPHVASRPEQSLVPRVERSVMVPKNQEHPFEGSHEVPCILPIAVGFLWPSKQPSHTF
jgi:hypothetical protein